jgi:hypothetical protein
VGPPDAIHSIFPDTTVLQTGARLRNADAVHVQRRSEKRGQGDEINLTEITREVAEQGRAEFGKKFGVQSLCC